MPHLQQAYTLSLDLGRTGALLSCSSVLKEPRGNDLFFIGEVVGGSEPHQSIIAVPNPKLLSISKKSLERARWHCSCPDFRFTFYPFLNDKGETLGEFPEYVPNGRGSPRAISNRGMCKHVICLINYLVEQNEFPPFPVNSE